MPPKRTPVRAVVRCPGALRALIPGKGTGGRFGLEYRPSPRRIDMSILGCT